MKRMKKRGALHREMNWRLMKQEKRLFGGLFCSLAAFSLYRSLFMDSNEICLILCQVTTGVFKFSKGRVWTQMVCLGQ